MAKTDGWASSLILGEPASVRFVQYTMQHAARLIGLLHRAVPHDVRRGAAAELNRHGRKLEGGSKLTAQRALGHSEKAAAQGLTKDYIGPILEDTWALRVMAAPIKLSRQHRQPSTLQGL
jgi:integrase